MSQEATVLEPATPPVEKAKSRSSSGLTRILRYTSVRLVTLFFTVLIGVYLTILIANMGGYVDTIRKGDIRETVMMSIMTDRAIQAMSVEARTQLIDDRIRQQEHRLGLDRPFAIRSLTFLQGAMTLDLGRANTMTSDSGSKLVKLIILERLPSTLVLFATENFFLFFLSLFMALFLSRRYGSFMDKATITLAPLSSAPGWFYGIFFILIFAAMLRVLPFGGMVDAPPPEEPLAYAGSVLKHMILPILSLITSAIFLSVYTWRTFFLIYSSEDYVEMAKAKGLSSRAIERRYVLRPTLPTIITSFALTLIGVWTGAPILETVFNWPGLGRTIFRAVGLYETSVIVGTTVIFSYLLAITVFLLDFIYALVDPRVKIGGESKRA
jgi:peptide/nickel transport system permease protein